MGQNRGSRFSRICNEVGENCLSSLRQRGFFKKTFVNLDVPCKQSFRSRQKSLYHFSILNTVNFHQIILKARFGVMNGCYGGKFVRSQHVVLKVFSESQCEQHGMELEVINSIFNKSQYVRGNYIHVFFFNKMFEYLIAVMMIF